jgi:iron complex outermembrane receptor protein
MVWERCLKGALVLVLAAPPARAAQSPAAQGVSPRQASDLAAMSLEELMNMQIITTSVARKDMPLFDSPAAITVITAQAIRLSVLATLPELLRAVPGLTVARINSSEWAITSRGFNDQYASKLLVLVDGRTIYTPMFSGVYWNANDIVLEDVERIEVIRCRCTSATSYMVTATAES